MASERDASNRESVRVLVRCRPLNSKEREAKHDVVVEMDKEMGQVIVCDADGKTRSWTYDGVFGQAYVEWYGQFTCWQYPDQASCRTTQESVFAESTISIVDSAMQGYNGTILAYGQTGTGEL